MITSIVFENYIRRLNLFSSQEVAVILSLVKPKRIKKGQFLLRQGSICKFRAFVCSGCIRSYQVDEKGREHIYSFSSGNHWVYDSVSIATGTPSNEFIEALEDSDIIHISSDNFELLLSDIPNFGLLNAKIITDDFSRSRERIYMMTNHQAEERYRQFIQHFPQLHKRLPMFMIASYIGVTRETLTRIRRKMICF